MLKLKKSSSCQSLPSDLSNNFSIGNLIKGSAALSFPSGTLIDVFPANRTMNFHKKFITETRISDDLE